MDILPKQPLSFIDLGLTKKGLSGAPVAASCSHQASDI
jgi:hypothetical protein